MPFIAVYDDCLVTPEEVEDGSKVTCRGCKEPMYPRGPTSDGRARHFFHSHGSGSGNCSGGGEGESTTHRKLKSWATSALRDDFESLASDYGMEKQIPAPNNPEKTHRIVDSYIIFENPHEQFGRGIFAEIQYRNEGKDIQKTTQDYVMQGYSVVWLEQGNFDEKGRFLSDFAEYAFSSVWPDHVPLEHEWKETDYEYQAIRDTWKAEWDSGGVTSGAPATLPPAWCDETAQELWNDFDWDELIDDVYASETYIDEVRQSLDSPTIDVDESLLIDSELLKPAYESGLRQTDSYRHELPLPDDWSGSLRVESQKSPVEIDVWFPPEIVENHRDHLRRRWAVFAEGEHDQLRRLSPTNANRTCIECGDAAEYYVRTEGVVSGFVCRQHLG